jgi:excisionase family DNA binding protein
MNTSTKSWVTVPQAARLLEVSPPVIRRLVARGVLSARKLPGTHARIAVADLVEVVQQYRTAQQAAHKRAGG